MRTALAKSGKTGQEVDVSGVIGAMGANLKLHPASTHQETAMPDYVPDNLFKQCPMCGFTWHCLKDFVSDESILFIGFQTGLQASTSGCFLFNHLRCATTLAVPLEAFTDLSAEPIPSASCETRGLEWEFCLSKAEDKPCPTTCVCHYVHHISFVLHHWTSHRLEH